jgi:hypothetical protein
VKTEKKSKFGKVIFFYGGVGSISVIFHDLSEKL